MQDVRQMMARAIAKGLGDDFDDAFVTKTEWTEARGKKGGRYRDINEPMQGDYLNAADAALAALDAERDKLRAEVRTMRNVAVIAHDERDALRDALENLIIGIGMGWDLEGMIEEAQKLLDRKL